MIMQNKCDIILYKKIRNSKVHSELRTLDIVFSNFS